MIKFIRAHRIFNELLYFFIILFISLCVYKIIRQLYSPIWLELSNATYGVITRKPDWIAYQNRLLGPYIVYIISLTGISYLSAFKVFELLIIVIQNLVLFILLLKINIPHRRSLAYVVLFSFAFICFQDYGFYTWDSIDVILFTLFSWGILKGKPATYFVLLFFVSIFNRESAFFISLYIIINSFCINLSNGSTKKLYLASRAKLVTGSFLTIAGIIYTKLIRDYLFISQPNGFFDKVHAQIGNHFHFYKNLADLFFNNLFSLNILNSAIVLGSIIYFAYYAKRYTERQLKAFVMFIILIVNDFNFWAN